MGFVADSLFNGQRFRALTIVDNFSRECLAIEASQSITGAEVAAAIERLITERGTPERIQCDNGSEFVSRTLDKWAYDNGAIMDFSRPGKPMDEAKKLHFWPDHFSGQAHANSLNREGVEFMNQNRSNSSLKVGHESK